MKHQSYDSFKNYFFSLVTFNPKRVNLSLILGKKCPNPLTHPNLLTNYPPKSIYLING